METLEIPVAETSLFSEDIQRPQLMKLLANDKTSFTSSQKLARAVLLLFLLAKKQDKQAQYYI